MEQERIGIMSKTLSNILTVFKVARIVAKVVFILCIVGGAGCLLGLVTLPFVGLVAPTEPSLASAYFGCLSGLIVCAGELLLAFWAERYFKGVLTTGTPFTFEGAKESLRLGIASLIISAATSVAVGMISFLFLLFASPNVSEFDISTSVSLSTGLFFLFLSLIFKHGAELRTSAAEEATSEEQASDENAR